MHPSLCSQPLHATFNTKKVSDHDISALRSPMLPGKYPRTSLPAEEELKLASHLIWYAESIWPSGRHPEPLWKSDVRSAELHCRTNIVLPHGESQWDFDVLRSAWTWYQCLHVCTCIFHGIYSNLEHTPAKKSPSGTATYLGGLSPTCTFWNRSTRENRKRLKNAIRKLNKVSGDHYKEQSRRSQRTLVLSPP